MYALNLDNENRILSACYVLPNGDYTGMSIVDSLPNGDVSEYLYIDGEYIYSPLPKPDPIEPAEEATTDEMAAAIAEGVNAI